MKKHILSFTALCMMAAFSVSAFACPPNGNANGSSMKADPKTGSYKTCTPGGHGKTCCVNGKGSASNEKATPAPVQPADPSQQKSDSKPAPTPTGGTPATPSK